MVFEHENETPRGFEPHQMAGSDSDTRDIGRIRIESEAQFHRVSKKGVDRVRLLNQAMHESSEDTPTGRVQQFLTRISSPIRLVDGKPLNVVLLPRDGSVNACAYPDGTVLVSAGLVKEAQTIEEIQGVIAHEYLHVYREHSRASYQTRERQDTAIKQMASDIGQRRLQEYEADLRGSVIDLDEAGINPLGVRNFFDRMHKREQSRGTGVVHGSSMDRALNISSVAHMIDLASMENELTPVPQDIHAELSSGVGSRWEDPWEDPSRDGSSQELTDQWQEGRTRFFENLDPKDIPMALSILREKSSLSSGSINRSDADAFLLLARRFREHFIPHEADAEQKKKMWYGAMWMYSGLPIFKEEMQNRLGIRAANFETAEDMARVREGIVEVSQHQDFQYLVSSLNEDTSLHRFERLSTITEHAKKLQLFGDIENDENADIEGLVVYLRDWDLAFSEIEARHSSTLERNVESELEMRLRFLYREIKSKQNRERMALFMAEELGIEIFDLQPEMKKAARELAQVKNSGDETSFLSALQSELNRIAPKMPIASLVDQVRLMMESAQSLRSGFDNKKIQEQENRLVKLRDEKLERITDDLELDDIDEDVMESQARTQTYQDEEARALSDRYLGFRALTEAITHCRDYQNMTKVERKIVVMGLARDFKMGVYKRVLDDIYDPKTAGSKEKRLYGTRVQLLRESLSQKWLERVDEAGLKNMFDVVTNQEDLRRRFGFLYDSNLRVVIAQEGLKDLLRAHFIGRLLGRPLKDSLEAVGEWKSENRNIDQLILENPSNTGPLALQIAEALRTNQLDSLDYREVLIASRWVNNPFLRGALQRQVTERVWPTLSFEEKLNLLFPVGDQPAILDFESRDVFFEKDVQEREQYHQVKERLRLFVEDIMEEGNENVALTALMDRSLRYRDVNRLMRALMTCSKDDRELKRIIYDEVRSTLATNSADGDEEERFEVPERTLMRILLASDRIVRTLFTLNDFGKTVLLRKLLASDGGSLPEQRRRKEFLKFLVEDWVQEGEDQENLSNVLTDVRRAMGNIPEWQLVYFGLQGPLRERIAQPPAPGKETPWYDLYEIEEDFEDVGSIKKVFRQVVWQQIPKAAQERPWEYTQQFATFAEDRLRAELTKLGMTGVREAKPMTQMELVKTVGSKAGAMGVRFLQQIPLITELSPEYEQEFLEVYDRVQGQTKVAALRLLEREWPGIWDEIEAVKERIGGGSIVTVYKAETKDGAEEVIKVRNPNIKTHLDEMYKFAKSVLREMVLDSGEKYETAQLLLEDIKLWVESDIDFSGFLEDDAEFRKRYQGFSVTGNKYKIRIPESRGPANPYFSREEYVPGTNLTDWEKLVERGANMKQVMSLVSKFYLEQLRVGTLHSDVHPGNYSVTENDEVVAYDRNFPTKLTPEEQGLIGTLLVGGSVEDRKETLFTFLTRDAEISNPDNIRDKIDSSIAALERQDVSGALRSLLQTRADGARIPLNLILTMKNLRMLDMLSKKAGFANFFESATA